MKLFQTDYGVVAERDGAFRRFPANVSFDSLFAAPDPRALAAASFAAGQACEAPATAQAPIGGQEVWAAGVTYLRSRVARASESEQSGGAVFYDRVYEAERPEIFFKATPHRVAGSGEAVWIRADSKWNVPEPELTLAFSAVGKLFGYTIGNDMSSRDIEGENPLYLPQAKLYHRSAALGPCLWIPETPIAKDTLIEISIVRGGAVAFSGSTAIDRIKRSFDELGSYLFRANRFPVGCFLMTGTGVVPPDSFTLQAGDRIEVRIAPIGLLVNTVEVSS